ncbi:protein rolling stone-like [Cryptosporidium felis]|nr:protein rolling stone-like [Cryptosporidium felis]
MSISMQEILSKMKVGWNLIAKRFIWEYKVSRALNRITFTFDEFEQTHHFNCSWIIPQWFLIYLRLFTLIYLIIMLGCDVANYYRLGCLMYWGVYVTNWTYAVTIIYYFFAATSTIYSYANNSIGRKKYIKSLETSGSPCSRPKRQVNNTNENGKFTDNNVFNGIQLTSQNLENSNNTNKEASYGHESIISISTAYESPVVLTSENKSPGVTNNKTGVTITSDITEADNDLNGQVQYTNQSKTRNIFVRYYYHLKSHMFIIKYCKETDRPYFADKVNRKMDNSTTNINLPLLIRLMWVFHSIALPSSFIVSIVYWGMSIISPVSVDGFTFLTFNKHGLTAIFLSIDTYVTTIPFFISQAFYSFLYCFIYLIFTIVYYILKLPNPKSQDDLGFIYSAINFADPAVAVPCSFGIFFLLFLTANIIWFFVGFSRNHIIDPLPSDDISSKEVRVNYYV